ncbi:MAG: hypothetical protein FWD28_04420 [Treponema sp.]|nr:hypothetical protein [Treponema sp.]
MGRKKVLILLSLSAILAALCLFVSCGTGSGTQGSSGSSGRRNDVFDPRSVSQAHYNTTRDEVQQFINRLNEIIRSRNYQAWRDCLSPDYFAEISSPENLREISNQPAMRTRRIVLRTPQDYFEYVVVPSRADLRVDDIEFISMNRVKAFTVTTNRAGEEQRLRLYDLEKIGNSWTIIN